MGETGHQDVVDGLRFVLPRPRLHLPLGAAKPDPALLGHDSLGVVLHTPLPLQCLGVLQGVVPVRVFIQLCRLATKSVTSLGVQLLPGMLERC